MTIVNGKCCTDRSQGSHHYIYFILYSKMSYTKISLQQLCRIQSESFIRSNTIESLQEPLSIQLRHNTFILAQLPSERGSREIMENSEAEEARQLGEELAMATRAGELARQARQPVRVYARIVPRIVPPQGEPVFVLNRPTFLLTCICILRLHNPGWYDQVIVERVRGSFPDIAIRARDIQPLVVATCQNCTRWMRELVQVTNADGRALTWRTLEVLRTNMLANSPMLPQDHYDDPRDGVRYLQNLVRVPEQDR